MFPSSQEMTPLYGPFLPTITTDEQVLTLHRQQVIITRENYNEQIKEIMRKYSLDENSAKQAYPYVNLQLN